MTAIDSNTEQRIQETLPKAHHICVDSCEIYLGSYQGNKYLRYVEGAWHITFDSQTESGERIPFLESLSSVFSGRLPKTYLVQLEIPLTWDAHTEIVSDDLEAIILERIERAVLQRYAKCRFDPVERSK